MGPSVAAASEKNWGQLITSCLSGSLRRRNSACAATVKSSTACCDATRHAVRRDRVKLGIEHAGFGVSQLMRLDQIKTDHCRGRVRKGQGTFTLPGLVYAQLDVNLRIRPRATSLAV
jgi:hypothetical protein